MKKLIKLIYLIFTALIAYGAAEGAFATSNVIEGVQEAYYGYTNQKDKESINPGKILLGENEYIILDNMSASMGTQALQIADYIKTKAEAKKATKTLSNINKTSNQSKTAFIINDKMKEYSVDPNFDFEHVIGGDVSERGNKMKIKCFYYESDLCFPTARIIHYEKYNINYSRYLLNYLKFTSLDAIKNELEDIKKIEKGEMKVSEGMIVIPDIYIYIYIENFIRT